jgi:hypothetical protein
LDGPAHDRLKHALSHARLGVVASLVDGRFLGHYFFFAGFFLPAIFMMLAFFAELRP